ncbi:MAG: hypothetical protein AAGA60_10755 [Cyanobacteria bacterium P01_E01_bin.42]
MQVRIHSALGRYPWAKLWYLCRALDDEGCGKIVLNLHSILFDLKVKSRSIIYHWIQQGKRCGAFRAAQRVGSMWHLYLGSLHTVCRLLGLPDWGTTFYVDIENIWNIRQLTTAAITFNLQEQSRRQAFLNLAPEERKTYRLPEAWEVITAEGKFPRGNSAADLTENAIPPKIPFLLCVTEQKAFVSKSFVPFGGSQKTIAARLGICDRTVRRHQVGLNIVRRQLCQTKGEYAALHDEIAMFGDAFVQEGNGFSKRSTYTRDAEQGKFFKMLGRTWVNRCNLYLDSYSAPYYIEMTSMRASKHDYWLSFGIDMDREVRELRTIWRHMGMKSRDFWRSDFYRAHKEALWEHIRRISDTQTAAGGRREGGFP